MKNIVENSEYKTLFITTDELRYVDVLASRDLRQLRSLVAGYDLLIVDEAQRVPDIGIALKLLADQIPQLKVIATGSSSFDLANQVEEAMTGRIWTYTLYPISLYELKELSNEFELSSQLEERLVYGSYPEVLTIPNQENRKEYLT